MPRPGPRPYECVRRAWHSDRHQPIRGSLIQEIFRIVNEVHSPSTRKNREWQEKLPIVVLKAEEIIYSKSSSEAEYSDIKTLWERVTEAIDTIIRRDESTETGELLQPCIEAALHLGCTPRRSSRSQRNECSRYYLRPETMEATYTSFPVPAPAPALNVAKATASAPLLLHYSQYALMNSLHSCSNTDHDSSLLARLSNEYSSTPAAAAAAAKKFPVLWKDSTPSHDHHAPPAPQTCSSSEPWSVYPLYDTKFSSTKSSNVLSHLMGGQQQRLSSNNHDASGFLIPSNHEQTSDKECDLTLRLGSLVAPRTAALQVGNGHSSKLVGRKLMGHLKK